MFGKKSKKSHKKYTKKEVKKEGKIVAKPMIMAMSPKPINIVDIVKQAIVQVKYEEIGSWLVMHKTPLFYAHKNGFSVVDHKFLDSHPKLKKELDKMVAEITKKKPESVQVKKNNESAEYIG